MRRAARRLANAAALAAIGAGAFLPDRIDAQTTSFGCGVAGAPVGATGGDACRKAQDLFAFVMPQAGVALSGGNPVLGEGGTMGGWGKRALSLRLSAVDGWLPKNAVPLSLGAPVSSDFGSARTVVPVPSVDAAIGLFAGVPAGLTNIGGVDVLLGLTYLPSVDEGDFRMAPQTSSFALSYGVRVGALQESSLVPGVSVSYMRRKLPTVSLGYSAANDSITVGNLAATSNTWRIVASKRLALVGVAIGAGRDDITNTARADAVVNETILGVPQRLIAVTELRNEVTRNTYFANLSFGLLMARVVAEAGWSSAGAADPTLNRFGGRQANDGFRYGSLGVTVRF